MREYKKQRARKDLHSLETLKTLKDMRTCVDVPLRLTLVDIIT